MKRISIITNLICVVIIAAMIVAIACSWNSIPDEIPVHFTFNGNPDAYGDKISIIKSPIIAGIMFIVLAVVEHFPKLWNLPVALTEENMEREYLIIGTMLSIIKVLIVILFLLTELSALIAGFPAWPLMILIILTLLVPIGGIVMSIRCR